MADAMTSGTGWAGDAKSGSGGGASGGATGNGGGGIGARTRPVLDTRKFLDDVATGEKPATEQPPEAAKPATQQAAERAATAYRNLDIEFGELPGSFRRAARTLAERYACVSEWDAVERAHDALREFETR